jgi:hypothetical protein
MYDVNSGKPASRVPLALDIEYRRNYARSSSSGILKNISITGAFLETDDEEILTKDKLTLNVNVGGRSRKITATVIWRNSKGAGLAFQPFNNRDVQIIDDLIYFVENRRQTRRTILDNIFKRVG